MSIQNGKHITKEIDGINCTIVESNATKSRVQFLESLLTFNKYSVKVIQNTESETYTIGVTDVTFNPVIAVYAKKLYTNKGKVVTPNIWNQKNENLHIPYWSEGKEEAELYKN